MKELVPDSEHRYCLRHMYQNFKTKYRGLELKDLFWKAATTGNKNEFEVHMKNISKVDPKSNATYETACEWLQKIPPVHWARSHFQTTSLSDVVVNNLCESFNSYILDARDKPIITMLESIRNKLMRRIQTKRAGMERYVGEICPNIMRKINRNKKFSKNFIALYCGECEYQIQCLSAQGNLSQYVVDFLKKTCSCGMFQLCGFPCSHACTAIGERRQRLEDYVHNCYSKDVYLKVYSHMIHAIPGQSDYCKTPWQPLNAPTFKRKRGRPTRLRRKNTDEGSRMSTRKGLTHTCTRCLELGHNRATCTNPIHPRSKMYKGQEQDQCNMEFKDQASHPHPSASKKTKCAPIRQSKHGSSRPQHQSFDASQSNPEGPPDMRRSTQPSSNSETSQASNRFPEDLGNAARRVQMHHLSRATTHASAMASGEESARATASAIVGSRVKACAMGDGVFKSAAVADATTQGANASSNARAHIAGTTMGSTSAIASTKTKGM